MAFARLELSEQHVRTIQRLLEDSPDWSSIMEMADFHGITPLMYWRLEQNPDNATNSLIPQEIRKHLSKAYYQNLVRNKILFHELKKMLTGLIEQGIKVIVLKGVLFAGILYGNPALRRMSDIDILVKPEDFEKVAAYLVDSGYVRPSDVESVVRESRYHHGQFVKGAVLIEVHFNLAQSRRFKIDIDNIWKRSIPARIDGVDVLRLSNEDIILHFCLHKAYHKFQIPLIWWTDFFEFIKKFKADIDWSYVVEKAIEQRIRTAVYFSLYFLKKIMKADIPAFALENLEVSFLRKKILFLFLDEKRLNLYKFTGKSRGYQLVMELFLIDRIENRLIFAVEFILRSLELFFYKCIPQIARK